MSLALFALAPALTLRTPLTPTLRTPPRARHLVAVDNATLTIGDALAGRLSSTIKELPDLEQNVRASFTLDAMLEASKAELDALQRELNEGLERSALNTTRALRVSLVRNEQRYLANLNKTAAKIETILAPSRAGVRVELDKLLTEQRAREDKKRSALGARTSFRSHMRSAAARAAEQATHPVLRVSEASAALLSLMLLATMGDLVASTHRLTDPPHVARVQMQIPRRTEEYAEADPYADVPDYSIDDVRAAWADLKAAPATPPPADADAGDALRANWWKAMRWVLGIYAASLAAIFSQAAEAPWAALALGLEPCAEGDEAAAGGVTGERPRRGSSRYVNWRYDWERDEWRED